MFLLLLALNFAGNFAYFLDFGAEIMEIGSSLSGYKDSKVESEYSLTTKTIPSAHGMDASDFCSYRIIPSSKSTSRRRRSTSTSRRRRSSSSSRSRLVKMEKYTKETSMAESKIAYAPAAKVTPLSTTKTTFVEKKRTKVVETEATMQRNQFYHALTELIKSFEQAKGLYRSSSTTLRDKSKLNLLTKAATAAQAGNYPLARDAIGKYRYLESMGTRKKRSTFSNIMTLLKNRLTQTEIASTFGLLGNTALSFVFDTTGSMSDEKLQMQNIAIEITNFRTNFGDPIQQYVLTEFNDPEYGPAQRHEKKSDFLDNLEKIKIQGGGDCEEYAMGGILLAMENTLDQNPIFVFTDAPPKDADIAEDVMDISMMYGDPIFFFFSPGCGEDFSSYQEVAEATGGMVLPLKKTDMSILSGIVDKIIDGIGTIAAGGITDNVTGKKKRGTLTTDIIITVDTTVAELIITVTFSTRIGTVTLHDPRNRKQDESKNSKTLEKIVIFDVKNPVIGQYKMKVSTPTGGTFTYKAMSASKPNLDFDFFFVETHKFRSTSVPIAVDQVVKGGASSLRITMTDNGKIDTSKMPVVELVAVGNSGTVQSKATNVKWLGVNYLTADVVVPSKKFRLKVSGYTKEGDKFERVGKTIVKPREMAIQLYYSRNEGIGKPGSTGSMLFRVYYNGPRLQEIVSVQSKTKLEVTYLSKSTRVTQGSYGLVSFRYRIPSTAKKGQHYTSIISIKSGAAAGQKAVTKCTVLVI